MSGYPLDKHRKYGTITPVYMGALYEQVTNGISRCYRADGTRVFVNGENAAEVLAAEDAEIAARRQPAPAPAATPALRGRGRPRKTADEPQPKPTGRFAKMKQHGAPENGMGDDFAVTLTSWAKGEHQAPFNLIADTIKANLDTEVSDEIEAAQALVTAGLVSAAEVKIV